MTYKKETNILHSVNDVFLWGERGVPVKSYKDYCHSISIMTKFTETWGWFIDLDTTNLNTTNKNTNINTNTNTNNNKFVFYKNKIQIYKEIYKEKVNHLLYRNPNITKQNITHIRSRQSISSKLSDLELQFQMDEDEDEERDIGNNNLYTKLLQGFCLIVIICLIV